MKELWLSRDKNEVNGQSYVLWDFKPKRDEDGDYWLDGALSSFTTERFCQLFTGIRPRPGQCVELREIRFVPKSVSKRKKRSKKK